ncbi:MAG: chemotaxis-specific protein-glutamate methyltransferase CheB [Deltaproteobacteria bacterium]|nr:chemotaxis-specific protein-glutamate methyltransferase CheB [Deltaproteobacteria bacterium]
MRIAIVNDLGLAVEALRRVVRSIPGAEIAWVARDGEQAIAQCERDRPDLVLMDLVMPVVDGVQATREIMRRSPCPVLVVTASVRGNVGKVYDALGCGALDAVATPRLGLAGDLAGAEDLIRKIATVHALAAQSETRGSASSAADAPAAAAPHTLPPLIAIGASTGGPHALATILAALPADLPAAVAVVQHIDRVFAPGLARWLGRRTALPVSPLVAAEPLRAARIVVAAGDGHLVLADDLQLKLSDTPRDTLHRPSIDIFLASVAQRVPGRAVGVLLTGMGRDGAAGLLAMRQAGHPTIAQDETSSIVYGMPKAAADLGAATEVLPLQRIAPRLVELVRKS